MSLDQNQAATERFDLPREGCLHISIPDQLRERLLEIQRDTQAESITEVVKNALMLYATAVKEYQRGGQVYFKRKEDGAVREIQIFI